MVPITFLFLDRSFYFCLICVCVILCIHTLYVYSLGPTYEACDMWPDSLAILLNAIIGSIHVPSNDVIFFFFMAKGSTTVHMPLLSLSIHLLTDILANPIN